MGSLWKMSQRLPIVIGLRNFYQVWGDFQTARELGEQAVALAQREPDDALRVHAHLGLAHTLFSLGEFVRARAHIEQGIAFYDPQRQDAYTFSQGKGAAVNSLTLLAWLLWYLGYPTQALTRVQKRLTWHNGSLIPRVVSMPSVLLPSCTNCVRKCLKPERTLKERWPSPGNMAWPFVRYSAPFS